MTERFILRTYEIRDRASERVSCLEAGAKRPMEVVIREHRPRRSEEQHRKFRAMVREFLAFLQHHTEYAGSFEDLYEELAERFYGTRDVRRLDGSLKSVRRSVNEMSKDEMVRAIEGLDQFMAEYGCVQGGNWNE